MYKWYQVLVQDLDENVDEYLNKDLDENLAWQTQKTENPKSNKGNLTFPTHLVNVIELQSNKKSGNPPSFSVLSPLSSKKLCTPQVTQFLEDPPPPFNNGRGF